MKVEPKIDDKVKVKYMEKDGKMVASWVGTKEARKTKTTTATSDHNKRGEKENRSCEVRVETIANKKGASVPPPFFEK